MGKHGYSYSFDQEQYFGGFQTPEQASEAAFDEQPLRTAVWVGENYQPHAEGYVDADLIIEHITCQDEYCIDAADGWPDATKEQYEELTESLRKVVGDWLDKHNLRERFFLVTNVKRIERCAE